MRPDRALGHILEPDEAENGGREEEAAVEVGPDDRQEGDRPETGRMTAPIRDEHEQDREAGHAQQLRAKREGRGRDGERAKGQERRVPRREAASEPDQQDCPEDATHEPRSKHRQARPATDVVDGREDDLRSPLLVEPRQAVRGERPRVDPRDRRHPDDLVTGAQVVGEVDRREAGKKRCQDGQRNGQERPESVQGHAGMLARRGAGTHQFESPASAVVGSM